jgi:RNA polymerase sigma-70 factor (ECF subfamily)
MIRIIRQYVPDCDMSQDVLHDGFLIILSQIQSLRNPEQLEYWMATIMKNLSLHSLSQIQFDDILEEPEDEADDVPTEELSYEELMALVDKLPDGYRTVFRLAVLEGKSHQEIAEMLGISPKSSASQLARAKEKLRVLVVEYKRQAGMLAVLALFLLPLSLYFISRRQDVEPSIEAIAPKDAWKREEPKAPNIEPDKTESPLLAASSVKRSLPVAVKTVVPALPASSEEEEKDEEVQELSTDTVAASQDTVLTTSVKKADTQELLADVPSAPISRKKRVKGWMMNVSTNALSSGMKGGASGNLESMGPMESPDDPSKYDEEETRATRSVNTLETHHLIPLTFGVHISKGIAPSWSVETGLQYTLLRSEYSNKASHYTEKVQAHFLSIPVSLQYHFLQGEQMNIYASGGASLDIPVGASWNVEGWNDHAKLHYPMAVGLNVGLGLEYKVSSAASLFVQPSLNYHIMDSSEYPILWQNKAVTFELPVGIRFNW